MKVRDFLNVCSSTTKISLFDYDSMVHLEYKILKTGFSEVENFTDYLDEEIEWISTDFKYQNDSEIQIFI